MAKLSSTARPASRQGPQQDQADDAQPSTAPARATRSTRSQSREPSVPPPDVNKAAPTKKRGRKAKQNDLTTVAEGVDDDEALREEVRAAEQAAADAADILDGIDVGRRGSAVSGLSGTTAKTSFSMEEIADLDAEVMVDVLPDLSLAADQLLKLLVPADPTNRPVVRKEIRVHGSRHQKQYTKRVEALELHWKDYGSLEYIQPSIVLRALLGVQNVEEVRNGLWRPDDIIYKANLAQMLRTTLIKLTDAVELDEEAYTSFELLETHFPSAIAGPNFDEESIKLALYMQTQLAITRLHIRSHDADFDPRETIGTTFFRKDSDEDLVYKHFEALHLLNAGEEEVGKWQQVIDGLVTDLRSPFDNGLGLLAALGQLRGKYPYETFTDAVYHYYDYRSSQLLQAISAAGGVEQIVSALADEIQRRNEAKVAGKLADERRKSFRQSLNGTPRSSGTPKQVFKKGGALGAAALRAKAVGLWGQDMPPPATAPAAPADRAPAPPVMDPRLSQSLPQPRVRERVQSPPVDPPQLQRRAQAQAQPQHQPQPKPQPQAAPQPQPQPQPESAVMQDDGYMPPPVDDDLPLQTTEQLQRRPVTNNEILAFQTQQKQNAKGKGRAFVDRQEGAAKISFDDESQPTPQRSSGRSPGKRSHAELEDFDPTQDEGFQTDERDHAAADARRRSLAAARPRPFAAPYPPRPSGSNTVDYELPASAPGTPSSSKRRRKNPGSTIPNFPTDDEPAVPPDSYQYAKIMAKQRRVQAQSKPPQVRTPWTPAEEDALVALIENYGEEGVSYAAIKRQDQDDVLHRRSAEDIRFKARNMKKTFILGRVDLPQNWRYVVLDKKAIDQIRGRGIAYHQEPQRATSRVAFDDA